MTIESQIDIDKYENIHGYPIELENAHHPHWFGPPPAGQQLYGRPVRNSRVNEIIKDFDRNRVVQPTLSDRSDGGTERYAIINGNHTIEALKRLGYKQWDCRVIFNLTVPQEAGLFHRLNTQGRRPSSNEIFTAKLAEEDKEALAIQELLDKYGIIRGKKVVLGQELNCIKLVEGLYKRAPELLEDTLDTLQVWISPIHTGTYGSDIVTAIYSLLAGIIILQDKNPDKKFNTDRMLQKMSQHTPAELHSRCVTLQSVGIGGSSRGANRGSNNAGVYALLEWYNYRLKANDRFEPSDFPTAGKTDVLMRIKEMYKFAK